MPDIHIRRDHHLGLPGARQLASRWVEQAKTRFDMRCTYQAGEAADEVQFSRSGVNGTLKVSGEHFELDAQLGFLLGAFKDRIEGEIAKNLDQLLAAKQATPQKKPA
jgi:putative polyhydroxyalkanoate system protein